MSTLKVEVCKIKKIKKHDNADNIEIAVVKGWDCIVPKGRYSKGDLVTYIPVDSILPQEFSDRINVTKYLTNGRVRAAMLRGVVSYGLVIDNENRNKDGADLTDYYGIKKYEPPESNKLKSGNAEKFNLLFTKYTDIENLQNIPDMFTDGEEVYATLKVHGTHCSYSIVKRGVFKVDFISASHNLQRRKPIVPWIYKLAKKFSRYKFARKFLIHDSMYWEWFNGAKNQRRLLLRYLMKKYNTKIVSLRAEIYGKGIQKKYDYGLKGHRDIIYDITVDGRYLDWEEVKYFCNEYGLDHVIDLYRGPFNMDVLNKLVNGEDGKGVECLLAKRNGAKHIMEGIVIKPVTERAGNDGRVIAKLISDQYRLDKNNSDFH